MQVGQVPQSLDTGAAARTWRANRDEVAETLGRGDARIHKAGREAIKLGGGTGNGGTTALVMVLETCERVTTVQSGLRWSAPGVVDLSACFVGASCKEGVRYGRADIRAKAILFLKEGCTRVPPKD